MIGFFFWALYALLLFVSLFLILLVLIQKGRGGGLSNAFGGGGGNTAFGSKTGDVLTWTTSVVFGIFMLLAVGLSLVGNARQHQMDGTAISTNVNSLPPTGTPATQPTGGESK